MTDDRTLESLLSERSSTVVTDDEPVTDVGPRGERVAVGLVEAGVRRHDSVAFQLGNTVDAVVAYRACWRVGARAVALHHRFTAREIDDVVARVRPNLLLRAPHELHELERAGSMPVEARPDDEAVVLFTAGSTGAPKGVRHAHRALVYKAELMREVHGLTPQDAVLMPAPLAHISGLLNGVLVPGATGMKVVLMRKWSPSEALRLIEREQITFMVGPPTFFVDLLEDQSFDPARVRSLRLVSTGGAGIPSSFITRASGALGAHVKRSYGSTEAPTVATTSADETDVPDDRDGHAVGDARLRIVDGELQVTGPELFVGYLDDDQTREAVTDDGWYRTGDLAELSADGWLKITGRAKEIIIRAGENISVREVEDVLHAHPRVRAATVVAVEHPRLGEQVAAVVATDGPFTLDDCRAWFEQQGVTTFKTPEIVVVVDALPVLATGKVDRDAVRTLAADHG